jgi:Ni/Fe-hydrogenase 1 B-type cytochrome subunit
MILAVAFLVRIYWALVGNHQRAGIFYIPFWSGAWWRGSRRQGATTCSCARSRTLWLGHNPMAQAAMFFMFTLGTLFLIVTGFALYAEQWGWGTPWMSWFGWVFVVFGDPQMVRTLHHLAMWYVLLFALVHMYMVFREDVMSGQTMIGTIVSGLRLFKREPGA